MSLHVPSSCTYCFQRLHQFMACCMPWRDAHRWLKCSIKIGSHFRRTTNTCYMQVQECRSDSEISCKIAIGMQSARSFASIDTLGTTLLASTHRWNYGCQWELSTFQIHCMHFWFSALSIQLHRWVFHWYQTSVRTCNTFFQIASSIARFCLQHPFHGHLCQQSNMLIWSPHACQCAPHAMCFTCM